MTEMEALKLLKDKQQAARRAPAKLDRRRWEGCSACASKCCELCLYQNFGGDDWPCNVCRDGFTGYKPVNYCPACGRPLTEEAWAELERRIGGNDGSADLLSCR